MIDVISGTTDIITNLTYIYDKIAEAKRDGLYEVVIDGKYIDEEKYQILLNEGYRITIRYNDFGTYPSYLILWDTNEPSIVVPNANYILIIGTNGEPVTLPGGSDGIFSSGITLTNTTTPSTPTTGVTLYTNSFNELSWVNNSGYTTTLSNRNNTSNLTYTLPNVSGTFGLLESTQTWTGINTFGNSVGIGTTPTHTLTLSNTSTGFSYYNTSDQTTNFERVRMYWSSNIFNIATENGGTGTGREINLSSNATLLTIRGNGASVGNGFITVSRTTSGNIEQFSVRGAYTNNSGIASASSIVTTINQTGTAGYRALWISPYEQTLGSGQEYLIDAGTNSASFGSGTHTSRFSVDNLGNTYINGTLGVGTASPSAIVDVIAPTTGTTNGIRVTRTGVSNQYIQMTLGTGNVHQIYSTGGSKALHIINNSTTVALGTNVDGITFQVPSSTANTVVNAMVITSGNLPNIGFGTTSPTHTLTLPSTTTGYAHYNTSDQTTNYERARLYWNTNIFTIETQLGGTGSNRNIKFNATATSVELGYNSTLQSAFAISRNGSHGNLVTLSGSLNNNSGVQQNFLSIIGQVSQGGTNGYRALWISPYESSTGSGNKLLIDVGTNSLADGGGTHTSRFVVDNLGEVGLMTTAPTHSLTFGNTSTGFAHYNTSDQTTNYERFRGYWSSNIYTMTTENGGTGVIRDIELVAAKPVSGPSLLLSPSNSLNSKIILNAGTAVANVNSVLINPNFSASSGLNNVLSISPIINQSGTAGYRGIFISPYELATGSGNKLLLDLGTNSASNGSGTHTSKFSVDNGGNLTTIGNITFSTNNTGIYSTHGSVVFGGSATNINGNANGINFYLNNVIQHKMFATGNVSIGTTTDGGFKLDVNGTSRFSGLITANGISSSDFIYANVTKILPSGSTFSGSNWNFTGSGNNYGLVNRDTISFNEDGFTVNGAIGWDKRLFLNRSSATGGSGVWSTANYMIINNGTTVQNGTVVTATFSGTGNFNTVSVYGTYSGPQSNTNTYTTFTIFDGTFLPKNITNAYGLRISNELSGSTITRGVDLDISSGAGKFNVYASGTANNYFAGNTLIGTTTDSGFKLDVNGTSRFSGNLKVENSTINTGDLTNFTLEGKALAFNTSNWVLGIKGGAYDIGTFTGIKILNGGSSEYFKWAGIAAVSETAASNSTGLSFWTQQAEKMRLTTAGFLGIGTTSPSAIIDVIAPVTGTTNGIRVTRSGVTTQYIQMGLVDGSAHQIYSTGDGKALHITNNSSSIASGTFSDGISFFVPTSIANTTVRALTITSGAIPNIGLLTNAPTHSLTFSSTTTGYAHYNTSDQTTNFERVRMYWNSNTFNINSEIGGTGVHRDINIISNVTTLTVKNGGVIGNGFVSVSRNTSSNGDQFTVRGVYTNSSGISTSSSIVTTINQTGTGGYRSLWISPYELALGSGSKLLIDAGTNSAADGSGTHTSRFVVDNLGEVGLMTSNPTHSLTLGSKSTGYVHYNTSDQTTNYERARMYWNSNTFTISNEILGTGTARSFSIVTNNRNFTINPNTVAGLGVFDLNHGSPGGGGINASFVAFRGGNSFSSGTVNELSIISSMNQTGTASYRGLWMSIYEQSVGSGTKQLIDLGTNTLADGLGTHTSRFSVDNVGNTFINGNLGVGTTSPNAIIDIYAPITGTTNGVRVTRSSVTTQYIQMDIGNGSSHQIFSNGTSKGLSITNNSLSVALGTNADGINFYVPSNTANSVANAMTITSGNLPNIGFGTTSPTHTLTLASTSTGFSYYNTSDQTTNYERLRMYWSSNIFTIATENGGTGTGREINLISNGALLAIRGNGASVGNGFVAVSRATSGNIEQFSVRGTYTNNSNIASASSIVTTINQTGTAGYRALWVSPYEQTVGSGSKLLLDLGTNSASFGSGTHTSRFSVDNLGNTYIAGNTLIGTTVDDGAKLQVGSGGSNFGLSQTPSVILGLNNTSTAGSIKLWGTTSGAYSMIQSSTGNLHLDTYTGTGNGVFLNFYNSTGFVDFLNYKFRFNSSGNGNMGIGTIIPTHTITLASGNTGIANYNTSDQTTNFERVRMYWSANTYNISSEIGGTGSYRDIKVDVNNVQIGFNQTGLNVGTKVGSSISNIFSVNYTLVGSSVIQNLASLYPTVNQSATGGYRGLWISPYELTLGSGIKLLIDAGTNTASGGGGTHTSRFTVDNSGNGYFSNNLSVNTTSTTSKLQVVGLPTYADNASAISGGLAVGAFYRTSTGVLMVVY